MPASKVETPEARLERARNLPGPDEARSFYDAWAKAYDADIVERLGFTGSDRIAERLAAHLADRGTAILDAGCGTGLAGARLAALGYRPIDGLDLSAAMLVQARRKGIYRRLIEADLLQRLPLADAAYGAGVCAGTFVAGHIGPQALGELVRVLRPGAPLAFTVAADWWESAGFADRLAVLEREGRLRRLELAPAANRRDGAGLAMFAVVLRL